MADIEQLIQRLGDPTTQREAISALRERGETAVEPLINALDSPNEVLRQQAANALGAIGDSRAVPHLIERMNATTDSMRSAAIISLGNFKGENAAITALQQLVQNTSADFSDRVSALFSFERVAGKEAATDLRLKLLRDPDRQFRFNIISQLGNSKQPHVVEALIAEASQMTESETRC